MRRSPAKRAEHGVGLVAEQRAEPGARLRANRDLGLADLAAEPAEEDLDERPAREAAVGVAASLEPRHVVGAGGRELGEEPGLADAGGVR